MTSTELVESDLRTVIAGFGEGQYVSAYDAVVDTLDESTRSTTIVNRKARVERFKDAVAKRDRKALAEANKLFQGFLRKVRNNAELSENMDEPRQLTVAEAESLMDEFIDIKKAKDLLTAREEEVKRLAFNHMTEQFAAEGEEYPEHINGSIDVPSLGFRFSREGAGRKDPELNEKALKALLGDALWAGVVDTHTEVVETLNIGKLMKLAAVEPAVLENLRKSLKVGEWKSPRLNNRAL